MVNFLTNLSADVLSSVLEFVCADALVRLVIVGNTSLNAKIRRSARRFAYTYAPSARFTWPKCFAYFPALEDISVRCNTDNTSSVAYEVDLLALPPTLHMLDLDFSNSLLCLVDLSLLAPIGAPNVVRLRPELREKFKNLKRLTWQPPMPIEMQHLDFSLFLEDLLRWPSLLFSWPRFRRLSLTQALQAPDTALSLSILLPSPGELPSKRLPFSLTHLDIYGGSTFVPSVLDLVPPNVETLIIDSQDVALCDASCLECDLAPLALLHQLTCLEIYVQTCTTEQMLLLPRALRSLTMHIRNAELETFGLFPPSLTSLLLSYTTLCSTTTGNIHTSSALDHRYGPLNGIGLNGDFYPSMRASVVFKLPRRLETISLTLMCIISPEDWDALPRGLRQISRRGSVASWPLCVENLPYVANLPPNIISVYITSKNSLELVESLPKGLVRLSLPLCARNLSAHSAEELLTLNALDNDILVGFSQRTPRLKSLSLSLDETFDLHLLRHLTLPITSLELHFKSRHTNDPEEPLQIISLQREIECFEKLEHLTFSNRALLAYQHAIPSMLELCKTLQSVSTTESLFASYYFSSKWIPSLPSSLVSFCAPLDRIDLNTFKSLPRSLREFSTINTEQGASLWNWQDLLFLPRTLVKVELPLPSHYVLTGDQIEPAIIEYLDSIMRVFFKDAAFRIGFDKEFNSLYSSHRPDPFLTMVAAEMHTRAMSPHAQQQHVEISGTEDDSLPPPKTRAKRKRRSHLQH